MSTSSETINHTLNCVWISNIQPTRQQRDAINKIGNFTISHIEEAEIIGNDDLMPHIVKILHDYNANMLAVEPDIFEYILHSIKDGTELDTLAFLLYDISTNYFMLIS